MTTRPDSRFFSQVAEMLLQAREHVARQVNSAMVLTYFEIGRMIVEEEQKGKERAGYGEALLKGLSEYLTAEFGRGFSATNLKQTRTFFLQYSIGQTVSDESDEPSKVLLNSGNSILQTASEELGVGEKPQTPSGRSDGEGEGGLIQQTPSAESDGEKGQAPSDQLRKSETLSRKFTLSWSHYLILMRTLFTNISDVSRVMRIKPTVVLTCMMVVCFSIVSHIICAQVNQVDTITQGFDEWRVQLIKAHKPDFRSYRLDVCFTRNDKSDCRDFGVTEDYRAFFILPDSIIDNVFVLVEFWEHNGMVHVLFPDGEWVSVNGSAIAIDHVKQTLYTKAVGDMQQTVGKISLSARKVEEKEWNNSIADPWDTGLDYYFPSNDAWLR